MRELSPSDVFGARIADIIISVPDKPVSMSDQSFSVGYIRLNNGHVIALSTATPPLLAHDVGLESVVRDSKYEAEFRRAIGQKVTDVVLTTDVGCLCVVTDGDLLITDVPAQFWQRPCIYKRTEFSQATEPFWKVPR
jgi:hypothetical protein